MKVYTRNSVYEVLPFTHHFSIRKVEQKRPSPAVLEGQIFYSPWVEITIDGVMRWYDSATGKTWHSSIVERVAE